MESLLLMLRLPCYFSVAHSPVTSGTSMSLLRRYPRACPSRPSPCCELLQRLHQLCRHQWSRGGDAEEPVAVSTRCSLCAFLHLSVTGLTSSTLADLRTRYNKAFPRSMDFTGLPFCSKMTTIRLLFCGLISYGRAMDYITPFT